MSHKILRSSKGCVLFIYFIKWMKIHYYSAILWLQLALNKEWLCGNHTQGSQDSRAGV